MQKLVLLGNIPEQRDILIRDDIRNHEYRFSPDDVAELFAADPTLH